MGKLIVFGGPSCSGKTSIKKQITSMFPLKYKSLVTCTTREIRDGEEHGKDYYFLSDDEFNWKIYQESFAEYTNYAGKQYGVLKETLDFVKDNHSFTIAIMDLNGLQKMINYMGKENVISFYISVSKEVMSHRLKQRGTSKVEVENRVNKAIQEEMKDVYKSNFDFVIDNNERNIDLVVFEIIDKIVQKSK